MKKIIVIALAMVLLLVSSAALGACGTGISQEDYDAAVAERDAAEMQAASIQAELFAAQAQVASLIQAAPDAAALVAAQSQVASLQAELVAAQSQAVGLEAELFAAQAQIASLIQAAPDAAELLVAQSQIVSLEAHIAILQAAQVVAQAQIVSLLQAAPDVAELLVAQSQVAVLQVTAKYLDVEVALADGYVPGGGGPCVSSPLGGMGIHYANPDLMDASINLLAPPILLYAPTEDGLKLIAVEYYYLALAELHTPNSGLWYEEDFEPADGWLTSAPILFGQSFNGPMVGHGLSPFGGVPGHGPNEPWHYDLHVWLWETNPSGMFADFNPNVSCSE